MTAHGVPVGATMVCAGVLTAQFVASKAARDAIYLAQLDVATLPQIVIATAFVSIALVALSSLTLRRVSPAAFVPIAFVVSALLFVVEWLVAGVAPSLVARVIYLHVSGLGPMLASGFWLIATERFDPYTAKREFGRIAGVGTLGGVLGAVVAERLAAQLDVFSILWLLAVLNLICAWQIRRLAAPLDRGAHPIDVSPELSAEPAGRGLHALADTPYLRHLAALVLLGSLAAALIEYVFKAEAVATLGRGEALLGFFAAYYAATTLITFIVQASANRAVLEKFGLAAATATPSTALLVGGAGALMLPGLPATAFARAAESVFRGSLFRSGYEVFYTPIASHERRAAKSIIDVGFDRCGEAIGGGMIQAAQMMTFANAYVALVGLAMTCSALALVIAARLRRGYLQMLERSLLNRAVELDLTEIQDVTTRTAMMRVLRSDSSKFLIRPEASGIRGQGSGVSDQGSGTTDHGSVIREQGSGISRQSRGVDPEVQQISDLRSRDRARVVAVLSAEDGIAGLLVPHVIPLLAWDAVANEAVRALQKIAEERVGELVDALLDPNQPFAVRRRLPRVLSICVSQRAADGLLLALDDLRFEVRFRCGRALAAIAERNARVRIDRERVLEAINREVTVSKPVWESRRLLDRLEEESGGRSFVDDYVASRASQSLEHVFTLLSLVLPAEPLRIAFRGLHTTDQRLRGTALEYLEIVLPPELRDRLWPFLEVPRPAKGPTRPREEVLADLLGSHRSIMLNIEELRKQERSPSLEQ